MNTLVFGAREIWLSVVMVDKSSAARCSYVDVMKCVVGPSETEDLVLCPA